MPCRVCDQGEVYALFHPVLHKENHLNKVIQIALVAITLGGIAVAIIGTTPSLAFIATDWGIAAAVVSFVALGVLRRTSSNALKRSILNAQSFDALRAIVHSGELKISFWGEMRLKVPNGETLHVDDLSRRVIRIAIRRDFNEEEREIGKEISQEINYIYSSIFRKNCFTFVMYALREFPWMDCTPRNTWCYYCSLQCLDDGYGLFDRYTDEQYQQAFGQAPTSAGCILSESFLTDQLTYVAPAPEKMKQMRQLYSNKTLEVLQESSEEQFGDFSKDFARITNEYLFYGI